MRIKGKLRDFQPGFCDDLPRTYKKMYKPPLNSFSIFIEYKKNHAALKYFIHSFPKP
jgi:hypothetical protein